MEVLTWAALGYTNEEIAMELVVSTETVKSHMRKILDKLGARNRANAIYIAVSLGWLSTGSEERRSIPSRRSLYE